jgi:hypothetical protein
MSRIRSLFAVLAIAALTITSTGCKEFAAAWPQVIPIVTNSLMVVQQIADFAGQFFKAAPNPDREKAVSQAVVRSRDALIEAQDKGATARSDAEVDEAFTSFRKEYASLLSECATIPGFAVAPDGEEPTFGASPGSLVVPSPNAIAH